MYARKISAGSYHINPESGIVEVLRPDGRPAAEGEVGELVVTSFIQRTVPLIRYRIGDMAIAQNGFCSCGRNMPLVNSITGRIDDLLWTPERSFVGRLSPALKSIPSSIREAQVAQTALDKVEVRYVPDEKRIKENHLKKLTVELQSRLGKSVKIEFVKMSQIPRSKNGKFRRIVREIDLPKNRCL